MFSNQKRGIPMIIQESKYSCLDCCESLWFGFKDWGYSKEFWTKMMRLEYNPLQTRPKRIIDQQKYRLKSRRDYWAEIKPQMCQSHQNVRSYLVVWMHWNKWFYCVCTFIIVFRSQVSYIYVSSRFDRYEYIISKTKIDFMFLQSPMFCEKIFSSK